MSSPVGLVPTKALLVSDGLVTTNRLLVTYPHVRIWITSGIPKMRMSAPGLFDWPRTRDEDIHEPPRALLPIMAGGHVSDADKSFK